jgi:hypothetical protein
MREINEAFYKQNEDLTQYATAVVLSHDCRTGELIFASAARQRCGITQVRKNGVGYTNEQPIRWRNSRAYLLDLSQKPNMNRRVCGLPKAICLSCTRTESRNVHTRRIRSWVSKVYASCYAVYQWNRLDSIALLTAVEEFRGSTPCRGDQSVIVLQKTDGCLS